jgi:hypothetical protein
MTLLVAHISYIYAFRCLNEMLIMRTTQKPTDNIQKP